MSDEPKIARLDEIDKRTHVGTEAWHNNNAANAQRLSAWRRLHALRPHEEVIKKVSPGDSTSKMVDQIKKYEAEDNA